MLKNLFTASFSGVLARQAFKTIAVLLGNLVIYSTSKQGHYKYE